MLVLLKLQVSALPMFDIREGYSTTIVGYLELAKCPLSKHCKIESYQVRKRVHIEKTILNGMQLACNAIDTKKVDIEKCRK